MWNTWMELPASAPLGTPRRGGAAEYTFAGYPWHDLPKYHSEAPWVVTGSGWELREYQVYPQRGNAVFVDAHAETVTFEEKLVTEEYIIYEEN